MHIVNQHLVTGELAVLAVFFDTEVGNFSSSFHSQLHLNNTKAMIPKLGLNQLIHGLDKSQLYHY